MMLLNKENLLQHYSVAEGLHKCRKSFFLLQVKSDKTPISQKTYLDPVVTTELWKQMAPNTEMVSVSQSRYRTIITKLIYRNNYCFIQSTWNRWKLVYKTAFHVTHHRRLQKIQEITSFILSTKHLTFVMLDFKDALTG